MRKSYRKLTEEEKKEYHMMTDGAKQLNLNECVRVYGYCRVSTPKQNIERQVRNIKEFYNAAIIIREEYTGTKINRPEWDKLMSNIKPGDTIIFDSVSRMSRSCKDGLDTYFCLYDNGINLIFLKEPHINTDTYKQAMNQTINSCNNEIADVFIDATNKVFKLLAKKQIEQAFEQAEKEVEDLRERTKEGIETARLNGKQIGNELGAKLNIKKEKPMKEAIMKYSKDFNGQLSDIDCIKLIGLSRNTYYKYKRELKNS